jgi:uncharacterized damage-inducible protein DinB
MDDKSITRFYAGWDRYNAQIVTVVRGMSDDQLAIQPAPDRWPLWATLGHTAGVRVYWLCGVLGEPGAEATPFKDPLSGVGWEDDLDHPRSSRELVMALESTWRVVERCLNSWDPEMLDESFTTPFGPRAHTRQSVLMRLLTHDAYHCGELSQTLGIHGLTQIDLWAPRAESAPARNGDAP